MSRAAMSRATVAAAGPGRSLTDNLPGLRAVAGLTSSERAHVWLLSLVGSVAVGLSGIFPLLVIPVEAGAALKTEVGCQKLKQLLSFAIGGLLGDVFLHLLPEAWENSAASDGDQNHYTNQGLWVILGLLVFLLLEKMFPDQDNQEETASQSDLNFNCAVMPSFSLALCLHGQTSGYLNLLANCIDNFTHGLAVAGSFLVSKKLRCKSEPIQKSTPQPLSVRPQAPPDGGWSHSRSTSTVVLTADVLQVGFLTTFAILLHEIPHEVRRWSPQHWPSALLLSGLLGVLMSFPAFRWETLPSSSGLVSTAGAPRACSCPRPRSGFWERALRSVLTHQKAPVRRPVCTVLSAELPLQLTPTLSPNVCRKCHRLDPALHRRRLPLHSFGERGARPAGGVQFKAVVAADPAHILRRGGHGPAVRRR
ncbi:unnamed protein product [Tetraodon nigroviridis]|uniref:Zinc transporter ZIP13 n=1 Tax=Tetraodon nigroviridis TaxID=99883 RepID=Q4SI36_TETNG|nr:unnamed protein product [Tetraodon nigroviridis]